MKIKSPEAGRKDCSGPVRDHCFCSTARLRSKLNATSQYDIFFLLLDAKSDFFSDPPPNLVANLGLLDSCGQPLLDAIEEDGQLLQRPAEVLGDVRLEGVAVLLLHVLAEAVQRGYLHPEQTFGILRIISRIQNKDKKIESKS